MPRDDKFNPNKAKKPEKSLQTRIQDGSLDDLLNIGKTILKDIKDHRNDEIDKIAIQFIHELNERAENLYKTIKLCDIRMTEELQEEFLLEAKNLKKAVSHFYRDFKKLDIRGKKGDAVKQTVESDYVFFKEKREKTKELIFNIITRQQKAKIAKQKEAKLSSEDIPPPPRRPPLGKGSGSDSEAAPPPPPPLAKKSSQRPSQRKEDAEPPPGPPSFKASPSERKSGRVEKKEESEADVPLAMHARQLQQEKSKVSKLTKVLGKPEFPPASVSMVEGAKKGLPEKVSMHTLTPQLRFLDKSQTIQGKEIQNIEQSYDIALQGMIKYSKIYLETIEELIKCKDPEKIMKINVEIMKLNNILKKIDTYINNNEDWLWSSSRAFIRILMKVNKARQECLSSGNKEIEKLGVESFDSYDKLLKKDAFGMMQFAKELQVKIEYGEDTDSDDEDEAYDKKKKPKKRT